MRPYQQACFSVTLALMFTLPVLAQMGIVSYWSFDAGSGDVVEDIACNNDCIIKKDPKLRSRVQELKSFESAYEKEYKMAKKTKMPKSLYEKISVEQNTKKNYALNKFSNFLGVSNNLVFIHKF